MTCNCIGGNPCPCQRGGLLIGRIDFGPNYTGAQQPPVTPQVDLTALLEKARQHVMTPKEVYDQRVSFIYGMLPFDSTTTKEDIKRHLAEMGVVDPEPESRPVGDS